MISSSPLAEQARISGGREELELRDARAWDEL